MSRAIILPIVTGIALVVQFVFGVTIPEEIINEVAVLIGNAILVVGSIVGIVNSHKKKKAQNDTSIQK